MKCPECQADNSDIQKFCGECGTKLERICSACNSLNPPQFKFCGECGHNLTILSEPKPKDFSFDEKLDKIQRYLPKGLTEKILSQKEKIEGERKQITVMFCDMEGFTPLVEKLGPEGAYSIMDDVYEILIHKVHTYEGTVNEMTGDGIMALFGAPVALEDAPQRAIRSAMAIHREMSRLKDKMWQEKEDAPSLKMRIGIHTGPVVVGSLGNNLRVEFKAVGDTVNMASRMEGLAEPGATFVTAETFRLTAGLFRFESLGKRAVKGKQKPISVFRVLAPSTRRTRFDVSAERGLTPFVARERELELLLDGFERIKAGRGQAFSIVAEAGMGKSRLLYEFRKTVGYENVTFLEGKCLSYGQGIAYHPIIDILKSNFNVQEDDSDTEINEKVSISAEMMGVQEPSTLPYILELLSVKDSGVDRYGLSPEARKDRIIEALRMVVLKGSEIRPLVIAIEDLHWADNRSAEVAESLIEVVPGAKVLLLFTFRPDFSPQWGSRSYHSQVNLYRLTTEQIFTMTFHLLDARELDGNLKDFIVNKTEGIPFFVEEFIKSLKGLGLIEIRGESYFLREDFHNLEIPSTIQEMLMARVDKLPGNAREILKIGSAIEREFSHELIHHLMEYPEAELLSCISLLKDSELIFERGIFPQSVYIFKHALTREIIYDSILSKRKKKYHGEIGLAIEALAKDTLDEVYEILTGHFIDSGNNDKGAEYAHLSCKKILKTASPYDAIDYAAKRIACLEQLPKTDDILEKLIDARTVLGLIYTQINYHLQAMETIRPILEPAVSIANKRRRSQLYTILGAYRYMVEEDFRGAFDPLGQALDLANEMNDILSSTQARYWLGLGQAMHCEFKKAEHQLIKVLEVNEAIGSQWGTSSLKSVLSYFVFYPQGKVDLGLETSKNAVRIANESRDTYTKSIAYIVHGVFCYCKGQFDKAMTYLSKGVELSEKCNFFSWNALAQFCMGDYLYEIGEYIKSTACFEKSIQKVTESNVGPSWCNIGRIGIARNITLSGGKDFDLDSLASRVSDFKITFYQGWICRTLFEAFINAGEADFSKIKIWILNAIQADSENGMRFSLGKDYLVYAEQLVKANEPRKAKENLKRAIDIFQECGAIGWVKKAQNIKAIVL